MAQGLTRWRPFEGLPSLRREMDNLWDRFFGGDWGLTPWQGKWAPSLDVSETKDNLVVKTELPGIDPKDVDISITDNTLTVKGEKKQEKEEKEENYHLIESGYGSFFRSLPLPMEVERDKVKANYKNGVLKITMPKSEKAKAKEVKVNID